MLFVHELHLLHPSLIDLWGRTNQGRERRHAQAFNAQKLFRLPSNTLPNDIYTFRIRQRASLMRVSIIVLNVSTTMYRDLLEGKRLADSADPPST